MKHLKPDAIIEVRFKTTEEGGRHDALVIRKAPYGCTVFIEGEAFDCRVLLENQTFELGGTYQLPVTLEVDCGADGTGDWVHFRIRDTGIGIAPDQLGHLFEPFSQADSSTSRKFGGTGLGLAITQKLCHMLGGIISLESVLDEGSVFDIALPVDLHHAAKHSRNAVIQTPGNKPASQVQNCVLVIDDDPSARDLIARYVRKEGFEAVCCASAKEGFSILADLTPMAITLDVMMDEGMNGLDALKVLKADPRLSAIPVTVITIAEEREQAYTVRASHYLPKPVDPDLFATILAEYARAAGIPGPIVAAV
jgi:adenylate cyclase